MTAFAPKSGRAALQELKDRFRRLCDPMRQLSLLALLIILVPSLLQAQVGDGRIYVRRIEFLGTDRIDDQVLRRELLQLEGTHINTVALEQSRLRLERLPYVELKQLPPRTFAGVLRD